MPNQNNNGITREAALIALNDQITELFNKANQVEPDSGWRAGEWEIIRGDYERYGNYLRDLRRMLRDGVPRRECILFAQRGPYVPKEVFRYLGLNL